MQCFLFKHPMLCVYITVCVSNVSTHREASGLGLFPADLGPTCSSMPAQQDTVDVGMTAVWATIHVSTHIHTVILTYSVLVTGKVQHLDKNTYSTAL